jgi:hypothetical protein
LLAWRVKERSGWRFLPRGSNFPHSIPAIRGKIFITTRNIENGNTIAVQPLDLDAVAIRVWRLLAWPGVGEWKLGIVFLPHHVHNGASKVLFL